MEAFVYCWTDKATEKLYVGVHKGTPDDGYICSSKPMMAEFKKRPKDFTREILASGIWPLMYQLETSLLSALQVHKDPMFYNQALNTGPFYHIGPRGPQSPEHREKNRKARLGHVATEESKVKVRNNRHTPEARAAISSSLKLQHATGIRKYGYKQSQEFCVKKRQEMLGNSYTLSKTWKLIEGKRKYSN